ncbi:MAG: PPC domain-containing protein [Anaerolinea sp.]|mgnify:CR=1 FL=1|nr:PPC domain-containing protein [Anaerolinea sp.]
MARLKLLLIVLGALLPFARLNAQTILTPFTEITGRIASGGSQQYTFTAQSGAVVSLIARATSEDFDPQIALIDQGGRELFSNDDYAYPDNRDALLEAVTLPRTETYTVEVSGYGETAGNFALTLLPGYGSPVTIEEFTEDGWEGVNNVRAAQQNNMLSLSLQGTRRAGAAFNPAVQAPANFMAQVDVISVSNPSGWTVGIAARQNGDDYYLYEVNVQGLWRFSRYEAGTATVLRDWTAHPGIVAGESAFTLGLLANGVGFDFFYNTAYVGSVNDSALNTDGGVGLAVGITSALSSETSAQFDNLIITTPVNVDDERVIPQQIPVGEGTALVLALKRQNLVAPDGVMALTLPESSVQYARGGVNRVMLGRGTTYTNFALGGVVDMQGSVPTEAGGCGIVFRFASETDYTLAYIEQTGGYGISKREGDVFLPGLFGQRETVQRGRHHLLIIADEGTLHYYVDREYMGSLENAPQDGQIGIAVVNFEGMTTLCSYSNLWLWEW